MYDKQVRQEVLRRLLMRSELVGDCLLWRGATNHGGYGLISVQGRMKSAHRVAWELAHGTLVPKGKLVCHKCDTPGCVLAAHLFLGSHLDNARDCRDKGRDNPVYGSTNGRSKMSAQGVRRMRALRRSDPRKWTHQALATEFGVGPTTVGYILNYETWKDT